MIKLLNNIMKKNKDMISYVTGKGLIAALIFKNYKGLSASKIATKICNICLKKGVLLVNTNRDSIKFGPPLIIKLTDLKKAMKILDESITNFKKNHAN